MSRAVAPVLAFFALGLALFGPQRDTDYDLQLITPESAASGELLPVRALLYENLRGLEGPRLSARTLELQLRARKGRVLAHTQLTPARSGYADIEGSLRLPSDARGTFRLLAFVQLDDVRVEVSRPLRVGEATKLPIEGRSMRALQQFSEGPIQAEAGAIAPALLRTRIGGGACVPEEECRVFVHVGPPGAALWVEGNSTVTPGASSAQPSAETAGIVALSVVTHGPEASLWLRASRGGSLVARRSVRLPIALGASQLKVSESVVAAPNLPRVSVLGGERGCIFDVFREGEWLRTASAPSCAEPSALPVPPLSPGVYRIQARRDPFGSSNAAVALAYLAAPKETRAQAFRVLAQRVVALDPADRFASAVTDAADADLQLDAAGFGYLAATLESGVIAMPRAVSGYTATLERLSERQSGLRWLSLVALALGAVSLALAVGRRGLRAAARADEILLDAGHTGAVRRRARVRAMVSLALSVLSLVLVFVVVGAYVMARSAP